MMINIYMFSHRYVKCQGVDTRILTSKSIKTTVCESENKCGIMTGRIRGRGPISKKFAKRKGEAKGKKKNESVTSNLNLTG